MDGLCLLSEEECESREEKLVRLRIRMKEITNEIQSCKSSIKKEELRKIKAEIQAKLTSENV